MKSLKTLEFVGATLTIVGSFLPWERASGFLGLVTNGIRIDVANFKYWITGIHKFPVYDYGGIFVVFLTLVIILLVLHPPGFIEDPVLWNLVVSTVLMVSSLFFVGRGLIHRYEYIGTVEQPTLMIGLICVVLGSVLSLWTAVMTYHQVVHHKSQSAG
jgi:hypothetical protein